jgi:hypothetical protein
VSLYEESMLKQAERDGYAGARFPTAEELRILGFKETYLRGAERRHRNILAELPPEETP